MSQTETLMLIALGFALAFIVVLLFGRVVWNIAMRLGAKRQAKQIPVIMLELQADRDRLRADHAMMSRKLELRLEDIKARMTEQMAEVSRHRNRVQSMVADLERRNETIKMRDREVVALATKLDESKADLAACYDTIEKMTAEGTNKENKISQQGALIAQISSGLREKNSIVNNPGQELQTALRLPDPRQSMLPNTGPTENRLMQRVAELTSISSQMSSQHESNPFPPHAELNDVRTHPPMETHGHQSSLDQQLVETERESAAMAEQLKALDAMMLPAIKPAPEPEPVKKSGAVANVISLAQRIRAPIKINN